MTMDEKTYFPWRDPDGIGLPGASDDVVIFDTVTAFGDKAAPHYRCFWVDLSFTLSSAGAGQFVHLMRGYTRPSDGTFFWLTADSVAVGAGITVVSFFVSPYQNWRIMYENGATPQTVFDVEMVIDHNSRDNP